jgi:hypothetical protein
VHQADRGAVRRRDPALRRALPAGADLHDVERGQPRQSAGGRRSRGGRGLLRRAAFRLPGLHDRRRRRPRLRVLPALAGALPGREHDHAAPVGAARLRRRHLRPHDRRRHRARHRAGKLWIEETGGLVSLRNAGGRATFAATEASAATAIDRAFAIAAANPRIARMYVYQWRANAGDRFDAGLMRADGTARPGYATLARDLAAQAAVRWKATWSARRPGRLLLRATCTTTDRVCRGRVRVAIAGHRLAVRAYRTSARHPTASAHVDVRRARRGARRVALAVRPSRPAFPTHQLTLTVTTPTTRR